MTTTTQISKSEVMKRAHSIYAYYKKNTRHAIMQNCTTWSDALKRAWSIEKAEAKSKKEQARKKASGNYLFPASFEGSFYAIRGRGTYCGD